MGCRCQRSVCVQICFSSMIRSDLVWMVAFLILLYRFLMMESFCLGVAALAPSAWLFGFGPVSAQILFGSEPHPASSVLHTPHWPFYYWSDCRCRFLAADLHISFSSYIIIHFASAVKSFAGKIGNADTNQSMILFAKLVQQEKDLPTGDLFALVKQLHYATIINYSKRIYRTHWQTTSSEGSTVKPWA